MNRVSASLPPWERGLKSIQEKLSDYEDASLPPWERGLKCLGIRDDYSVKLVAPPVGAWVEIKTQAWQCLVSKVAPLVGAWVEINNPSGIRS